MYKEGKKIVDDTMKPRMPCMLWQWVSRNACKNICHQTHGLYKVLTPAALSVMGLWAIDNSITCLRKWLEDMTQPYSELTVNCVRLKKKKREWHGGERGGSRHKSNLLLKNISTQPNIMSSCPWSKKVVQIHVIHHSSSACHLLHFLICTGAQCQASEIKGSAE